MSIASHVQSGCFRIKPFCCLLSLAIAYAVCAFGSQPQESGESITLARALALTLERSPQLAAFSWDIRAAEARILQAKLVPNPEISWDGEDFTRAGVQSATESMQNTLVLSQLIELENRGSRVREARLDRRAAEWDYQVKRFDFSKQLVSPSSTC